MGGWQGYIAGARGLLFVPAAPWAVCPVRCVRVLTPPAEVSECQRPLKLPSSCRQFATHKSDMYKSDAMSSTITNRRDNAEAVVMNGAKSRNTHKFVAVLRHANLYHHNAQSAYTGVRYQSEKTNCIFRVIEGRGTLFTPYRVTGTAPWTHCSAQIYTWKTLGAAT